MTPVAPELVQELLACPTEGERLDYLSQTGLLSEPGLRELLDIADELVYSDPGAACRLSDVCAAAARMGVSRAAPRAAYLCAVAQATVGAYSEAFTLLDQARDGWLALGDELEALRTGLGRMHVLDDLGKHGASVDVGRALLAALDEADLIEGQPTSRRLELRARTHNDLGRSYWFTGRYGAALDAFEAAREHYVASGATKELGLTLINRGEVLLELGRAADAIDIFDQASRWFSHHHQGLLHACSLYQRGKASLVLGQYLEGLQAFEQSRVLLDPLGSGLDRGLLLLFTAEAYLVINLHQEALSTFTEAERSLRSLGTRYYLGVALIGKSSTLIALGRPDEAESALAEAAHLFQGRDNERMQAVVLLERAALHSENGDRAGALALARAAIGVLEGGDWPVQLVHAHLLTADLALPDEQKAGRHLVAAGALVDDLGLPHLRYRLDRRLGHLRRLQGRLDEAEHFLRSAIDTIEGLRTTLVTESMRASFLRDKTDVHAELITLLLDRGDDNSLRAAFSIAERAKSRALVDLLAGTVHTRLAATSDNPAAQRLQLLQDDLTAVYNELLGADETGLRGLRIDALRSRAELLERETNLLRLQLPASVQAGDELGAPVSLEQLRARVPGELVVLAFHTLSDEVVAFVSVGERLNVIRAVSSMSGVQLLLHRLDAQWQRFRSGDEFAQRHSARLLASTQRILHALYIELIKPVSDFLGNAPGDVPRLAIVPHGALHQVPFHALFDGRQYLIERFEVTYAPSATVLGMRTRAGAGDSRGALVMGLADAHIPGVREEAALVAQRLPEACLRLDSAATAESLRAEAPGREIVHLACHGMFRAESPMFSALRFSDQWFTAFDALELSLSGALVTLSACESGRSTIIGGGDEIIGLARAFLGAGADAVAVSLWLVQDDTTAALMDRWYSRICDGQRRAAALRAAQLELLEKFPHPYYWAPFVLIGSP